MQREGRINMADKDAAFWLVMAIGPFALWGAIHYWFNGPGDDHEQS